MAADLHLHTHFSDGTYSPEELAGHAGRVGLEAVALTDHDTVDGCERMATACAALGLEFVPGVELTAELDDREMHLLAYFVETRNPGLRVELERCQRVRQQRIHEMVERLNELGVPLEARTVFALANCQSPGRPHVARAMVQQGLCPSLDEAFERFLKKHRPAWVPKLKISALDAIELTHRAGGLAVLAHPGLNKVDHLITTLVRAGLDGLECFHTKHPAATAEHYLALARRHGLLVTGGSDCHGLSKGRPLIGTVRLAREHFERLRTAARSRVAPAPAPASR